LIVSNNQEFLALFEKAHVVKSMKILKTALALNRGIHLSEPFEKVGLHCIDIYIVREELKKFIKDNSVDSAINLANKVIKVYVEEVCIVKNELLEIAKMAKKASVLFYFDPRKFKYNLPKNFIDEYFSELALLDFEMENDSNKKLKIIEKIHKDFPEKIEILINLLDFIMGNEALKYDDKKILNLIGATLSVNPDRRLSEYLLKLGRKDILEITQSLTFSISDKNKEKLWLLLIIATKMGFFLQCKELVKKIIEVDPSDDIIKFFVKNHLVLSRAPDIISILVGKELKNTNIKNLNL
jgi:hypothetical protein